MHKSTVWLGLVALALVFSVYGCGDETQTPTEPAPQLDGALRLEVPTCGEDAYLSELSPLLPVWQDSLESWQPDTTLTDTPEWTGGPVADHLAVLVPALQQWQGALNTVIGSDVFAAVDDFDPEVTTNQAYLTGLSALLAGWKTAAEDERGTEFLPAPPTFAADEFAPLMECPSDTTFTCADTAGVVLEFEVTAMDDCDEAPVVVCDPPSGSTFKAGTTTVTCTATDASGNESTCTFDVTVEVDDAGPVIECPEDIVVECVTTDTAVVEFEVTATDTCDDAPVVVCEPASGSEFPVGTTTVTCTATDALGNESTCTFDVTVEMAEVVVHGATASPSIIWPPNHKMVDISFEMDVENECDLELDCEIVEVTSNEPINGPGDGNTEPDWMIGEDGSLKLRAERSGTGSGRIYSVLLRCEHSESGMGDETTVEIVVPHDMGGEADDSDD
jgi:hypothetical protein